MHPFEYQSHDDQQPFDDVLDLIRKGEIQNAVVTFSRDGGRLHYKVAGSVKHEVVAGALGLM